MNEINLGSFKMPINSATKTFAILAKRGAGKSYTAGVLAEEFYKSNIPFVIFDPIDIWWGLKLNRDGKDKGLPIVVFGLQHEDIKLTKDIGRKIAQAVVKHNISCVISTFGMPKNQQRFLITEFAEEILNINNTPRHIFIEEAHEYVPQRVFGDMGKCFNAVSNLVVMGRNRGLGVTLINQRASTINKDVLTQIDSLLAFRNVAPQDRKALKEWVEYHTAEGDFEKFMASLPTLPTGEGWIWSPEFLGVFERIKIRQRETFHPDREKIGNIFEMPKLEQTDVLEFINEFFKDNKPSLVQGKKPQETIMNLDFEKEQIKIKNEYETKLMQKDLEIRKKDEIINQIKKILNIESSISNIIVSSNNSSVQLWMEKLGKGMPYNIFRFLIEHSGIGFTRSQIALGTGYSSNSGSFSNALGLLRRNLLIKEENGLIKINPDL